MNTERDLALIRLASIARGYASRFLLSGFLALVLRAHTRAGGEDNRVTTRQSLVDHKVPIAALKKISRPKQPGRRRDALDSLNQRVQDRRAIRGGRLSRGEYREICQNPGSSSAVAARVTEIVVPAPTLPSSAAVRPPKKRTRTVEESPPPLAVHPYPSLSPWLALVLILFPASAFRLPLPFPFLYRWDAFGRIGPDRVKPIFPFTAHSPLGAHWPIDVSNP